MSMNKIKKRKRKEERPATHPRNKYSENPPDFAHLASLYPSFQPLVFVSRDGRPRIDWTDFNATWELTWVLLLHDHRLNCWYTSMVGRKLNVKILTSKLWEVGVTMVKTTGFVQSQTSRWVGAGLVLFASCQQVTIISCGCEEQSLFHA
ncbi:hypothetical protein C1H46_030358 [Malus baccata]|uniref:Uncharacterized protein n=1 Tax=Malus baccata TaxID=106549 RepID=A0A540LCK8_MALBA|nr:hypothetical protein C1H46_030358 [Malus baccata]